MTRRTRAYLKSLLFLFCLYPLAETIWQFFGGAYVNPVEAVLHRMGLWALRFLWLTLLITPLRRVTGWNELVRYRRMLGLFAFAYASLHLVVYLVLDRGLYLSTIVEDVAKRPYITVGFASFLILVPIAVTSTRKWIARLGRRWRRLHQLVYLSAIGGFFHFLWLVKADTREPMMYGAILAVLLAVRLVLWYRERGAA